MEAIELNKIFLTAEQMQQFPGKTHINWSRNLPGDVSDVTLLDWEQYDEQDPKLLLPPSVNNLTIIATNIPYINQLPTTLT